MIAANIGGERRPYWAGITMSAILATAVSGCSAGAPSLSLFGAYFPVWLACSLFGVAIALIMRAVVLKTGTAGAIPVQLLVCVCAGIIGGVVLSWLWLGV